MIRDEIRTCLLTRSEESDGAFEAAFRFPAAFTGFQGHFPGRPVLPGLCLLQAALVAAAGDGQPLALRELVNVKFFAVVEPDMDIVMLGARQTDAQGATLLRVTVEGPGGQRMAQLRLALQAPAAAQAETRANS